MHKTGFFNTGTKRDGYVVYGYDPTASATTSPARQRHELKPLESSQLASLAFLDDVVEAALAAGAAPYVPPEARGGKAQDERAKGGAVGGLRFEAYEPAPYAVPLAGSSASHTSGAGDSRSSAVAHSGAPSSAVASGAAAASASGPSFSAPSEPQLVLKGAAGRRWGPAQYEAEAQAPAPSAASYSFGPSTSAAAGAGSGAPRSGHHSLNASGSAPLRLPPAAPASRPSAARTAAAPAPAAASRPTPAPANPLDLLMDLGAPLPPGPGLTGPAPGAAGPGGDWMDSLMGPAPHQPPQAQAPHMGMGGGGMGMMGGPGMGGMGPGGGMMGGGGVPNGGGMGGPMGGGTYGGGGPHQMVPGPGVGQGYGGPPQAGWLGAPGGMGQAGGMHSQPPPQQQQRPAAGADPFVDLLGLAPGLTHKVLEKKRLVRDPSMTYKGTLPEIGAFLLADPVIGPKMDQRDGCFFNTGTKYKGHSVYGYDPTLASLAFLDDAVEAALAAGAAPYVPPEARGGKAQDERAKGLRFEAYEPAPYAVPLAGSSASHTSGAGDSRSSAVAHSGASSSARLHNIHLERIVWQPSERVTKIRTKAFQDAKRALVGLAKSQGYDDLWIERSAVNDEGGALMLAAAQEAGVAAWLLRTLGSLPKRIDAATDPATAPEVVCIQIAAVCVDSEAAGTALSLCLAALCTWRSAQGWGGTGPHAAALLDPALLTALAQAARGMADLARHTALPSTQTLVGAAGSPRPQGPSCARACAALALAASQYLQTAMLVLADHLGGVEEMEAGFITPLPGLVPQLAGALRESGLAAAAASTTMTCPGSPFHTLAEALRESGLAAAAAWALMTCPGPNTLRVKGQASAALGEAVGQPQVAELRLAALEGLWEQAGVGPGQEERQEASWDALRSALQAAGVTEVLGLAHGRTVSGTLGLWQSAQCGQLFLAGGGCLPPKPGVPPELQLALRTESFLFHVLDEGLPPAAWASADAPLWAEAAAWALATAVETLARDPPDAAPPSAAASARQAPQPDQGHRPAEAVAGALERVDRVAWGLHAAWRRAAGAGTAQNPAGASSSGRDSVLPRLRRAGLGASLDHALRLAYAAADRAAAPGAAAWAVELAHLLRPVPARAWAVVALLDLELLGPVEEGAGARLGPGLGLSLGLRAAGGLAVTVAKRAMALAGQLEERAEAAPAEAGAAAVLSQAADAAAQGAAPGTIGAEGAEAAPATRADMPASSGSPRAGPHLPSPAEPLSHSTTALCTCIFLLRQQRVGLLLPKASQSAPAAAGPALTSLASVKPGHSAAAGAASPDAPAPQAGVTTAGPVSESTSVSSAGTSLVLAGSATTAPQVGSTGGVSTSAGNDSSSGGSSAASHAAASGAPPPSPAPGAWGPLAAELEAYVLQAGSRLAACAVAEAAAGAAGRGLEAAGLVGSCLSSIAALCYTSEPGCPLVEARLLALQPHRLAAAACKLLCAWRVPPASAPAEAAAGAAGGSEGGEAPGRATRVSPTVVAGVLPLALASMAAHSPQLASRVRSFLLPPPPDGCAEAEEAGAAGQAEERGCLAQAWPAALRSQAAAGAKDASALGLALLRAAQGGGGGGGGEGGSGCGGGGSDGCPMPHDRFQQAGASLLAWWYAKGRGEHGPPTAMVAELVTPRPGEDSGPLDAAEAAAAVVAAPLPPLLASPPAGRVLTQLLVCGGPGCASFGGRSEAELPLKRCGGCKAVRYCGSACQRAHWGGGHKAECGAMGPAAAVMRAEEREGASKRHH
ncbi:hypothetical protein HYH03_014898 [Edaphochlamys debaryana]|uniref:phytol kinase n=1 Tax=Edaphochlamys debaryana TaxID=47281 RepID=A0A835XM90_9CHLO|nr:hypothetical protein HYH03_014898 [Edaphochlamys debaryana]|eukprot:KAG2486451.1 hypothetical protein HYH03_014898 [Edaphochlamys debaryana]